MSKCDFSGNQISVIFQRTSAMMAARSRKALVFATTSMTKPLLHEAIISFYQLFIDKISFLTTATNVSSEEML